MRVLLLACSALTGSTLLADVGKVNFLERGLGDEEEVEDGSVWTVGNELEDIIEEMLEGKPKGRAALKNKTRRSKENLTKSLDQIIPLLEADFKKKTAELKRVLLDFKDHQKQLDFAKKEATLAMKDLRKEAEKRRKLVLEKKRDKEKERKAKEEAKRAQKDAMVKKAQMLMGSKTNGEFTGMLGEVTLGIMVDVLMALPKAVDNPLFLKRIGKAKVEIANTVQDFLNITRRKTGKFVTASGRASDVELSFLMTRYFHEASFRVKSMQADAEKVARDLNVVMPRELRQAFMPIVKQVRKQAVPLRVNASTLAAASQHEACNQISGLMSNITDYNTKLSSMHTSMHNVWQMSELLLPHMGKIYPIKAEVVDLVKDFMSLATTQIAGLQESADEIVTQVGPVISERMQCTWSAARSRFGLGLVTVLAALVAQIFA